MDQPYLSRPHLAGCPQRTSQFLQGERCLNSLQFSVGNCARFCLVSSLSGLIPPRSHLRWVRELRPPLSSEGNRHLQTGPPKPALRLQGDFCKKPSTHLSGKPSPPAMPGQCILNKPSDCSVTGLQSQGCCSQWSQ